MVDEVGSDRKTRRMLPRPEWVVRVHVKKQNQHCNRACLATYRIEELKNRKHVPVHFEKEFYYESCDSGELSEYVQVGC